jgi:hypothetical protein
LGSKSSICELLFLSVLVRVERFFLVGQKNCDALNDLLSLSIRISCDRTGSVIARWFQPTTVNLTSGGTKLFAQKRTKGDFSSHVCATVLCVSKCEAHKARVSCVCFCTSNCATKYSRLSLGFYVCNQMYLLTSIKFLFLLRSENSVQ